MSALTGLIDTHFHLLELKIRNVNPTELLMQLAAEGFTTGIDIGVRDDDIDERLALLDAWPNIKVSAGIGPWGAQDDQIIETMVERFLNRIAGKRVDAIGEIGLDYHWNYGTQERQRTLFRLQLAAAESLQLPVVIHTRDADSHMGQELRDAPLNYGGIMHCFSSSAELAHTALDAGLYISFAGPITYRKNNQLREILAQVPIDRLLLETDSPYLSPHPFRGTINTPMRMIEIYAEAARIRCMEIPELAAQIQENFFALFSAESGRG